jgi:2-haloacid dehalogenase
LNFGFVEGAAPRANRVSALLGDCPLAAKLGYDAGCQSWRGSNTGPSRMHPFYVFDAYGTLFDVHSSAARQAAVIGERWERLSQIWRTKHLEYTWIHAQTGRHTRFWTLAERSLDFAIASVGGVPDGVREKLLDGYRQLSAYPEVPAVLADLRRRGAKTAILTNGDPDVIADAISSAGLAGALDRVFTVHSVGVFKPNARVYRSVTDEFGCSPADVSFQSSNRWDIAGAKVFGFHTVWINRSQAPDEYPDMPADRTVRDLGGLLA